MTEATNDEVEPDVLVTATGTTGRLTLNRPQAINALTHYLVTVMTSALDGWVGDSVITQVVLDGRGERGFCAGGDIRAIHRTPGSTPTTTA